MNIQFRINCTLKINLEIIKVYKTLKINKIIKKPIKIIKKSYLLIVFNNPLLTINFKKGISLIILYIKKIL
jgi:hypothetical protein